MDDLFTLNGAVEHDPRIAAWFDVTDPFRAMVQPWFAVLRGCGDDVRETLCDMGPAVLIADAPFAYVNAFKAHAAVGFFRGAELPDPAGLLEGSGRLMRHVKLRPGQPVNEPALRALAAAAYDGMRARVAAR